MKLIARFASLLLVAACGQADVSDYHLVSLSAVRFLGPGQEPPLDCAAVGPVAISERNPSFFARHFGLAEEEFYRALDDQLKPLNANLILLDEGSDLLASASSGQPFRGTAYVCP